MIIRIECSLLPDCEERARQDSTALPRVALVHPGGAC